MRRSPPIALLAIVTLVGCPRTHRTGAIIDQYSKAECVSVRFGPGISPPTRAWDDVLKTREGIIVHVSGAEMPGGRINVSFLSDGKEAVAANAGDYIYPADVRFEPTSNRMYIKASGIPAAFGGPQTWLFEYNLKKRRQTGRAKVDPSVLPQECAVSTGPSPVVQ